MIALSCSHDAHALHMKNSVINIAVAPWAMQD